MKLYISYYYQILKMYVEYETANHPTRSGDEVNILQLEIKVAVVLVFNEEERRQNV